jgi:hypothetical protein
MMLLKIQALASLVASSGEFLEERLDRVRTYYDLLTIPFEVSDLNCSTRTFRDMLVNRDHDVYSFFYILIKLQTSKRPLRY